MKFRSFFLKALRLDSNKVPKIKGKSFNKWKYVSTKENPADLEGRGCEILKLNNKWLEGHKWFQEWKKYNGQNNQKLKIARNLI